MSWLAKQSEATSNYVMETSLSFANHRITYHGKLYAQTGRPQPNISTIFIGRSRPLDEVWRHTPKFALAVISIRDGIHQCLSSYTSLLSQASVNHNLIVFLKTSFFLSFFLVARYPSLIYLRGPPHFIDLLLLVKTKLLYFHIIDLHIRICSYYFYLQCYKQ